MDFKFSSEQKMIQKEIKDFAQKEIADLAAGIDEDNEYPYSLIKQISELGLMGLTVSEDFGGNKMDFISLVLAIKEISKISATVGYLVAAQNIVGYILERTISVNAGTHLRKLLQEISCGGKTGAFITDEDQIKLKISAAQDFYMINGACGYVLLSDIADVFVVAVRSKNVLPSGSAGCFIVEGGRPGLKVNKKNELIGLKGAHIGQLVFENYRLDGDNILCEADNADKIINEVLNLDKLCASAVLLGIGEKCIESALEYSKKRRQFNQPIFEFDLVREMLGVMDMENRALQSLVFLTASKFDEDAGCAKEAAHAKLFAVKCSQICTSRAIQIYGGYGYSKDYPIERYFRDAKVLEVLNAPVF